MKVNTSMVKHDIKNRLSEKKYIYAYLYVWLTCICMSIIFFYVCINGGSVLAKWLFCNTGDTGNDFFNCIPAVRGYGLGYGLVDMYPPLAKLFFLLMARIYSFDNIPLDTAIRNSMTDLRMQQAALVPFITFVLVTVIATIVLVSEIFTDDKKQSISAGVSVIGTYSIIFAIERGNYILLAFVFLMYFIVNYRSGNKLKREMALISLALSSGLKLYPAAFGILLLYEKRWKDSLRAIIYGLSPMIIPYIIAKRYLPGEGTDSAINGIVGWGVKLAGHLFDARSAYQKIFIIVSILIAIVGIIFVGIKSDKYWLNAFYAGILAMILGLQFEYAYTYIFLIPAMIIFWREEEKTNIKNVIYFIMFCIIHLPLPIFGDALYGNIPLVSEIKMWTLFVMMIFVTLMEGAERIWRCRS